MKFQSATTILAAVVLAASSLDSVSSFVPTSMTRASAVVQATKLSVASQEIVNEAETDVKPRKTREVRHKISVSAITFCLPCRVKPRHRLF